MRNVASTALSLSLSVCGSSALAQSSDSGFGALNEALGGRRDQTAKQVERLRTQSSTDHADPVVTTEPFHALSLPQVPGVPRWRFNISEIMAEARERSGRWLTNERVALSERARVHEARLSGLLGGGGEEPIVARGERDGAVLGDSKQTGEMEGNHPIVDRGKDTLIKGGASDGAIVNQELSIPDWLDAEIANRETLHSDSPRSVTADGAPVAVSAGLQYPGFDMGKTVRGGSLGYAAYTCVDSAWKGVTGRPGPAGDLDLTCTIDSLCYSVGATLRDCYKEGSLPSFCASPNQLPGVGTSRILGEVARRSWVVYQDCLEYGKALTNGQERSAAPVSVTPRRRE